MSTTEANPNTAATEGEADSSPNGQKMTAPSAMGKSTPVSNSTHNLIVRTSSNDTMGTKDQSIAINYSDMRSLFSTLDAAFLRYEKNRIEPILWQAKDFNVQYKHEVKVPAIAGSTVKYTFSTSNGDIEFSLHYQTTNNLLEVIREPMREPSHVEAIKGSYKAVYDGVFIFIFDNSFSWFTDKLLSYNIQLLQVSSHTPIIISLILYLLTTSVLCAACICYG
jgi:hypothetical protein